MELRHLRYFVAVAEARSLKLAAEETLHTTQPSLSRQIRDLEEELGTPLFSRNSRGVELTPAGRVFLEHARTLLAQTEKAIASVRSSATPAKTSFAIGVMVGHDTTWGPAALSVLREELADIHLVISTQSSPQLSVAATAGLVDLAFLRREDADPSLEVRHLVDEPIEVFLREDHHLARQEAIGIEDIEGQTFLSISGRALDPLGKPPALRSMLDRYLRSSGVDLKPSHEVDNLGSMMSLIASTNGIALLPTYARGFLHGPVAARSLRGRTPTIDLSVGYLRSNASPILELFLSRLGMLVTKATRPPLRAVGV